MSKYQVISDNATNYSIDDILNDIKKLHNNNNKLYKEIENHNINYLKQINKANNEFMEKGNTLRTKLNNIHEEIISHNKSLTLDSSKLQEFEKSLNKKSKQVVINISNILKCMALTSSSSCKNDICSWAGDDKKKLKDDYNNYICYPNKLDWNEENSFYSDFLTKHIDGIKKIATKENDYNEKMSSFYELVKEKDDKLYNLIKDNSFLELANEINSLKQKIEKKEKQISDVESQLIDLNETHKKNKNNTIKENDKFIEEKNDKINENNNKLMILEKKLRESYQSSTNMTNKAYKEISQSNNLVKPVVQSNQVINLENIQDTTYDTLRQTDNTNKQTDNTNKQTDNSNKQTDKQTDQSANGVVVTNQENSVKEINNIFWNNLRLGYLENENTFLRYNLEKEEKGFNIYDYIKCYSKDKYNFTIETLEFSDTGNNYLKLVGSYDKKSFTLYIYLNIIIKKDCLKIQFNIDPRSKIKYKQFNKISKSLSLILIKYSILLLTLHPVDKTVDENIDNLFINYDLGTNVSNITKGDFKFIFDGMSKSLKKVLREKIYLYSSPPKGKKIHIKYDNMKPLEKSNDTCNKHSIVGFIYNKKKNSSNQLNERFDKKTQCRESGCKWPRGNNICESYFNENDKYFEFILSGEIYKKIQLFDNYFKTNNDKQETIINIKSLNDDEKNKLYQNLNSKNSDYTNIKNIILNNIWLQITTDSKSPFYLDIILSKYNTTDLNSYMKNIFVDDKSGLCDEKLYFNNMKGGRILRYKVLYKL